MSAARVAGLPDALEAFTRETTAWTRELDGAVATYRARLAALHAAPSELPVALPDRSGAVAAALDDLRELLAVPEAFAFGLRELDRRGVDLDACLSDDHRLLLQELVLARLEMPGAPPDRVVAQAEHRRRMQHLGRELADELFAHLAEPEAHAPLAARLQELASDPAFVLAFLARWSGFDREEIARREADRLNRETGWFGPTFMAMHGEVVEVQEMGLGSAARALLYGARNLWRWVRRRPPVAPPRPRPVVSHPGLRNAVDELFNAVDRAGRVGDGTTMAVARWELRTGLPYMGRNHVSKLVNRRSHIRNLLRGGELSGADRTIARTLLREIDEILRGVPRP